MASQFSPQEEAQFEEVLLGLAARHGGIEPLLRTFFAFLHRKTDFYVTFPPGTANARMGFAEGDAERLLLKQFRSFPYKPLPGLSPSPSPPATSTHRASAPTAAPPAASSSTSSGGGGGGGGGTSAGVSAAARAASSSKPAVQYTEEGKQVPIGNGGATDRYYWTQSLEEATVYIDVPSSGAATTRAKDVRCEWGADRVKLSVAGNVLLEGELGGVVRPSECLWTLEGGSTLVLSLEKAKPSWWRSVVKGDPEIDTSKVDSTAKVADYDAETQGALRKIMFDQQQKARGLPTSDELQMQALLEKASLLPGSPFAAEAQGREGGGGGGKTGDGGGES